MVVSWLFLIREDYGWYYVALLSITRHLPIARDCQRARRQLRWERRVHIEGSATPARQSGRGNRRPRICGNPEDETLSVVP